MLLTCDFCHSENCKKDLGKTRIFAIVLPFVVFLAIAQLLKSSVQGVCLFVIYQVIVFVDDLNMPQPDDYHSHPPLELLRQFLDSGGFFDTKKLLWKEVHDVTLLSACSPPGGGRSLINDRLLRHFR